VAVAEVRAFIALPLSPSAEYQLDSVAGLLSKQLAVPRQTHIRWLAAESYHLTLAFLGNIQTARLAGLEQLIAAVAADFQPQTLYLSELAWFPSALKPRLIVALPQANPVLLALQKQLVSSLRREGFNCHGQAFRPHISLARISGEMTVMDLAALPITIATSMDELLLYKSQLDRNGANYTPLLAAKIGATL
jgi:2'-5' RNA ligase